MTNEELDGLLAILRKHNVSEYSNDQFGTKVWFDSPLGGLREWLPKQGDPTPLLDPAPTKVEPPGPAPGAVEPTQDDLDDLLYGAK